ncbi:microtubule-binding protein TANGLED1 [Iris pallida]|uniref:Microtubule-binding protein TANGLED1 n=1 Tax=Iris pallida TaxID=29817 RepID=A0AAX6GAK0_IRIPA|nr:microtubule-binding protein TANGLED1 [Iris pallida]
MVAKTPLKGKRLAVALNPNLVRETVNKVDRCMARLQELQYTVTGGTKEISGIRLSPRSTRAYLRTSLRCKQETLRMNAAARKSPPGKLQGNTGEWRRLSLPGMLLGETVVEVLQASKFAKDIVAAAAAKSAAKDHPGTPDTAIRRRSKNKVHCENADLRARRTKEKQGLASWTARSEANSPPGLPRARSRIVFKSSSPLRSNARPVAVAANRVSPKNRPWAKKTVLFPNPLFLSSSSSSPRSTNQKKFYKTRSPMIGRTTTTQQKTTPPRKFLVKSPSSSLKSQFKSKKAVPTPIVFSPVIEKKARRCSFSPSKLASRLVSPLKSARLSFQKNSSGKMMSGLKIASAIKRRM